MSALRCHARPLARFGCMAIGSVYVLIGGVALVALTGHLIEYADENRIGYLIKRVPGGVVLLWAIAAGAAAWVIWRLIEALTDPYNAGCGWSGVVQRACPVLSGFAYGLVGYAAVLAAVRPAPGSRDAAEQQQQIFVGRVLHWPGGPWIVGAVGVMVIAIGLLQFWLAFRGVYRTQIRLDARTPWRSRVIHVLARYGYSARGVILCVLGYLCIRGAAMKRPALVGDTDTAFDFIGGGVIGDSAFAIVALGTVAFGVFMYANAWLYRFEPEPESAGKGTG